MSRAIAPALVSSLLREEGPEALVCFLQVDHPSFDMPARMVCDVIAYTWRGLHWHPVVFDTILLTDRDSPPEARLTIPAHQDVSQALLGLAGEPTASIWVLSAAEFDQGVEIGTPAVIYGFEAFRLVDVQGDAVQIGGRLVLRDYATEPWPGVRATQDRFPGLFA